MIQNFTGAVAESSSAAGTFSQARLRSTANDGAANIINVRVGTSPRTLIRQLADRDLIPGDVDDQMDLTYMSAARAGGNGALLGDRRHRHLRCLRLRDLGTSIAG